MTSLTEPDKFDPSSETALDDPSFFTPTTDNSGMMSILPNDLAEVLSEHDALESILYALLITSFSAPKRLLNGQVTSVLVKKCYAGLNDKTLATPGP